MISKVRIRVLVDDYPSSENMKLYTAHGLSLLVEVLDRDNAINLLIDGGPSPEILLNNARNLKVDLSKITAYILTIPLFHHSYGLFNLLNRKLRRDSYHQAMRKLMKHNFYPVIIDDIFLLKVEEGFWKEKIVILNHRKGLIAILGCSVYGFEKSADLLLSLKGLRLYGIIGGFGLSLLDTFSVKKIDEVIAKKDIEVILPLHSTTIKARKYLISEWNAIDGGVGTDIVI